MKATANVECNASSAHQSVRVEISVESERGGYGKPDPIIGTLDKLFVQTRQTAVAITKEQTT